MGIVALVVASATLWVAQALGLSRLMSSRGFDPLPWLAMSLLLGPAMWPLAVIDLVSGSPEPVLLKRGERGEGTLDAFVAFDGDELHQSIALQIQRLQPHCSRLVLARVVKAGGPAFIAPDAERFLRDSASRLGAQEAELQLHHGVFADVVRAIRDRGDFDVVLRSDEPPELFEGNGSRPEMRCLRDGTAA